MPKYMLDYIRLCRECSLDLRTIGNMHSIVIPALQQEATAIRAAVSEFAGPSLSLSKTPNCWSQPYGPESSAARLSPTSKSCSQHD